MKGLVWYKGISSDEKDHDVVIGRAETPAEYMEPESNLSTRSSNIDSNKKRRFSGGPNSDTEGRVQCASQ